RTTPLTSLNCPRNTPLTAGTTPRHARAPIPGRAGLIPGKLVFREKNMIQIGKKGRIVQGDLRGQFILIQENSNSSGIFILMSESRDFKGQVADDWVEDRDSLEQYFQERQWVIEWLE